jgi:hypothetical protein
LNTLRKTLDRKEMIATEVGGITATQVADYNEARRAACRPTPDARVERMLG